MRSIKFPYTIHKGLAIPYIPLILKIGKTQRRFWTFVDTGATFTIIKVSEIEDLDFDYREGKLVNVQVGDGGFIPIYLHKLKMTLDDFTFTATVGFSNKLGVEFNLLGRKDVFHTFDVIFREASGEIIFISSEE